jgi:hypothetical protein
MPLFHFNSRTDDTMLPDLEGEQLPDIEAALEVAMSSSSRGARRSGKVR